MSLTFLTTNQCSSCTLIDRGQTISREYKIQSFWLLSFKTLSHLKVIKCLQTEELQNLTYILDYVKKNKNNKDKTANIWCCCFDLWVYKCSHLMVYVYDVNSHTARV